ncbi:hypothetical protein C7S16_3655 [Burkholderia thailandensis]|uniref:Uncharacterized protein n=1 Tax=Burkholderia thailandensis TaxID=57975 RepID=A0AAW9CY47_BURTH|nr:hypothetical protein [Burkholderia thailandensis]MDW9254581.1 hypothetical protein [Burkholderia thailandensis]
MFAVSCRAGRLRRWCDGYRVVVSTVVHAYGDGAFRHRVPDSPRARIG